jgi:hypothetical protein
MATLLALLNLYSWVLVGALVYILYRIARFYQFKYAELYHDKPRQRTLAVLLIIPLLLFPLAAVRYALLDTKIGDLLSDLAYLLGGLVLAGTSYHLYRLLMGRRR